MVQVFRLDDKAWRDAMGKVSVIVGENFSKTLMAGVVVLAPHQRIPHQGYSQHLQSDEIAYVVEGVAVFGKEDEEILVRESDFLFNPRGTKHYVLNPGDKPCKIIWALAPPIML